MRTTGKIALFLVMVLFISGCIRTPEENIVDDSIPFAPTDLTFVVSQGPSDLVVIPDKYNTGHDANTPLTLVDEQGTYEGIYYKSSSGGTKLALDFFHNNKDVGDTIVIENMDFSSTPLVFLNDNKVTSKKTVTFINCKFSIITSSREDSYVSYFFENSSIGSFSGSNATFKKCAFGGTNFDALNPLRNVILEDCFISDLAHPLSTRVLHSDGSQFYGFKNIDTTNIRYTNCRFEVPDIPFSKNVGVYVNSCISLALEYSSGYDITFENCIINGGGYSIYALTKSTTPYTITDTIFKDIKIGASHRWGDIYYRVSDGVQFENISDTTALYVGSVWKDDANKIHLSVSNDTNTERTLVILTENGTQEVIIPACPVFSELKVDQTTYADFPFDLDVVVDGSSDWVVVYDSSISKENQIRYYNWGTETVYMPINETESVEIDTNPVTEEQPAPITIRETSGEADSGICGDTIAYTLDLDGTLTLIGSGSTYNYTSTNPAPWYDNREAITSVVIGEGIQELGSQLFRKSSNLVHVSLPEGLVLIGGNAFIACNALETISFPSSLMSIGNYAFGGTKITNVSYAGTETEWKNVLISNNNDPVLNATKLFDTIPIVTPTLLGSGSIGKDVNWVLSDNGNLVLEGFGSTYDYSSSKPSPWSNFKSDITSVTIDANITYLGAQLFIDCLNLTSITIPEGVTELGGNIFIRCFGLETISFSNHLTVIGKNATLATGLTDVYYNGTETDWNSITLGVNNSGIDQATLHFLK